VEPSYYETIYNTDDDPSTIITAKTIGVELGSPLAMVADIVTTTVMSDPTDRSNSPETITNNSPAARMASAARS